MADPVTLMVAAGAALKTMGTIAEVQGAAAEAGAQAKVAQANATATGQQTAAAEDAQRRRNREFLARQRAAIGEAGIGFGGSTAKVQEQSAIEAELDALNIRYNGTLKRQSFESEAAMARANKKSIVRAGFMKAAGGLLSGGADTFQAYGNRPRKA